jgi:hypothetical protein
MLAKWRVALSKSAILLALSSSEVIAFACARYSCATHCSSLGEYLFVVIESSQALSQKIKAGSKIKVILLMVLGYFVGKGKYFIAHQDIWRREKYVTLL